jgi:hypothetical protein
MTVKALIAMLESFDDDSEIAVEIEKDSGETVVTYDVGFNYS